MGAVAVADRLDAAKDLFEREVFDRLGMLGQIAGGAIEIAALRDLECDTADRPAPSHRLARIPLAGRDYRLACPVERGCRTRHSRHRRPAHFPTGRSNVNSPQFVRSRGEVMLSDPAEVERRQRILMDAL